MFERQQIWIGSEYNETYGYAKGQGTMHIFSSEASVDVIELTDIERMKFIRDSNDDLIIQNFEDSDDKIIISDFYNNQNQYWLRFQDNHFMNLSNLEFFPNERNMYFGSSESDVYIYEKRMNATYLFLKQKDSNVTDVLNISANKSEIELVYSSSDLIIQFANSPDDQI